MKGVLPISLVTYLYFLPNLSNGAKKLNIPPNFPNCHRFDPKMSECLLAATESMKPFLDAGIPELEIPSFQNFSIPQILLQQGTSAVNFNATLRNVQATGLTNYTFTKFDFDVPKLFFTVEGDIGSITLKGDYSVKGKVLLAPIEGGGRFTATMDGCHVFLVEQCAVIKKGNIEYLHPTQTNTTIKVGGPKVTLDGLFGGNKELNDATNRAINDNINVLFEEVRPVIEKIITEIVTELLIKAILTKIPWDSLYPPIK